MATPIEQAKTKLKQKNARLPTGPVSRFFAPVPDRVRARDIFRETPGAIAEVGKTVIQETALAPVRTALSLADIPRTAAGLPPLQPIKVPLLGEAVSAQRDVTRRIKAGEDPLLAALGAGSLAVLDVATLGLAAQQVVSFLRGSSNAAISKAAIKMGEPTTFDVGRIYDMTIGKTPPAGSIQNKIEVFLRDPFFRQMKKENFKGGLLDYVKTKGFNALRVFGDDGVSKTMITPRVAEPIAAEAIGAVAGRAAQITERGLAGVVDEAYQSTVRSGGVTISLEGNKPTQGIAFSPYKGVETIVPKDAFTPQTVRDFMEKHSRELAEEGSHLGMWESEGNIFLDISRVGEAIPETLQKAIDAKQLAAFDLSTFTEIPLGRIENNVYNQLHEAFNHPYFSTRQVTRAGASGATGELAEVPSGAAEKNAALPGILPGRLVPLSTPALATGEGTITRVLEKVLKKPYTTLQELREMSRSADVPPLEKEFWNELTIDPTIMEGKRIPVAQVERLVQEYAISTTPEKVTRHSSYGVENLGESFDSTHTVLVKTPSIKEFEYPEPHFSSSTSDPDEIMGHFRYGLSKDGDEVTQTVLELQSKFFAENDVEKFLLEKYGFTDKFDTIKEQIALKFDKAREGVIPASEVGGYQDTLKAAKKALAEELITKMNPSEKQVINISRNRRFIDRLIGEALAEGQAVGATKVRFPTPSTISKIEWGKGAGEDVMPYTRMNGRRFTRDDELTFGDELDHAGEEYKVVDVSGDDITVAPAKKVREYDVDDVARESAESDFENRELYDFQNIEKETGFDVTSTGGAQSYLNLIKPKRDELNALKAQRSEWVGEWKQAHPVQNVEAGWAWTHRGETAWKNRFKVRGEKLDNLEREPQYEGHQTEDIINAVAEEGDYDRLRDKAMQSYLEGFDVKDYFSGMGDEVFFQDRGRGSEVAWVVEGDGNTINFSQPSRYSDRDPDALMSMDRDITLLDELGFSEDEKAVLTNYYHARKTIEKELRKRKIELKDVTDDSGNTWMEFPMTKLPRYLFGLAPLALPQEK